MERYFISSQEIVTHFFHFFFSLSHASFSLVIPSLPFWSLCRVPSIANILKRIRKVNKPFCRTPAVVISARAQPFTLQDKFIKVEGRISYSHRFSFFGVVPPQPWEARLLLNKLVCLSRASFNFNRLVNRYETFVSASGDRLRDSLEEIAKYAN